MTAALNEGEDESNKVICKAKVKWKNQKIAEKKRDIGNAKANKKVVEKV